jgi:signal transduction histidine kinase/ligand-binding sensor domain-containing protein
LIPRNFAQFHTIPHDFTQHASVFFANMPSLFNRARRMIASAATFTAATFTIATLVTAIATAAVIAAAFTFAPASASARASESAAEYSLREWHGNDGLPDEVVHAVVQDAQGYLWVATEGGLARFNGIRFDAFAPPADATGPDGGAGAGAGSRGVPAIARHRGHGLLLAYGNGEIWQWTGSELRRAPVAALFSKGRVASWFTQADGALWADFSDGHLECLRDGRVTKITLAHSPLAGHPLRFADDGEGGVWIAARAALYHFRAHDAGDATAASIILPPFPADFSRDEIGIASSRLGKPWIIAGDVLGRWDSERITDPMSLPRFLSAHFVHDLVEDRDGNLWVGTRSQGVYMVSAGGGEYQLMPASHRTVRSVCQDAEGNIWLATNGGGLDRLQAKRFRLYDSSAGLDDDLTFTVSEDRPGVVWLANRDGGMVRVRGGKITKSPAGWPTGSAGRVFPDNEAGVWFTAGSGLFKTDDEGNPSSRIADPALFKNMRVMFVTRRNELWLGGDAGEIGRFTAGGFAAFGPDSGFPANQRPAAIIEDAAGRIIVGTNAGDLYRFDPAAVAGNGNAAIAGDNNDNGNANATAADGNTTAAALAATIATPAPAFATAAATPRFTPLRQPGAPPLIAVRSLLIDDAGTLWVGTGGAGVQLITAGGQEHRLDQTSGLPDDMISQMLFDDHGRVWFGSSHGIFSADRTDVAEYIANRARAIRTTTFGKNEGLDHISCLNGYQPHCWKTHDGTLWFTTRRGTLAIDPQILAPGREPPVFIDALLVDGKNIPLVRSPETRHSAAPAPTAPLAPASVKIRSDARRVEILFSALNFTAPERTAVRYRLHGFDTGWLTAGPARKLVYPRLYPGEYLLQIDAADEDGRWNDPDAASGATKPDLSLAIIIVPFWWQTLWFRAAAGLVLAALLVAGVRAWSFRRLRRKLERIEREATINRERTRIARDIHDEVGASLTRVSLLSQYAPPAAANPAPASEISNLKSEISSSRACLDEIYSTTTSITRSINEIVWAIDTRHDNLESMVSYFDSYAQRFLTVAKIRYRLRAPAAIPAIHVSSRVRHDLFLAFKETLNNCAKYSAATEVLVQIALDARALTITVTDDGRGITPGAAPGGGGQGLANLVLRLAAIGGAATIHSTQPKSPDNPAPASVSAQNKTGTNNPTSQNTPPARQRPIQNPQSKIQNLSVPAPVLAQPGGTKVAFTIPLAKIAA